MNIPEVATVSVVFLPVEREKYIERRTGNFGVSVAGSARSNGSGRNFSYPLSDLYDK